MAATGLETAVKIMKRLKMNYGPAMVLPILIAFLDV
jgi:hypothetical protein